ncbi:hypothetical protein CYMTET_22192 [Cymbomonas tetramitiformis]|uniref:Uncharacterized protein n=1 Tax=Cymbomonas tetramitiformis TaxID=36881 RepID=A0AAE0G126_9CHLO|nr:hypothetical protein CYMTET_22192 [Cymbomonas tetramitiformis]
MDRWFLSSKFDVSNFHPISRLYCLPKIGYYGGFGETAQVCPEGAGCCTCEEDSFASLSEGLDQLHNIDGFNYDGYCKCISGSLDVPFPLPGHCRSEDPSRLDQIIACPNKDNCDGALAAVVEYELLLLHDDITLLDVEAVTSTRTSPYTSGHCKEGTTGRLCVACANDFFDMSGTCIKCPKSFMSKLLLTLGGSLCVIATWVLLSVYMSSIYSSINLLLLYLQISSMLQSFSMDWPESIVSWGVVQKIVNFDVDFISPKCIIPEYDYKWSFYLQFLLPIIVMSANAVDYVVRRCLKMYSMRCKVTEGDDESHALAELNVEMAQLWNAKIAIMLSFQVIPRPMVPVCIPQCLALCRWRAVLWVPTISVCLPLVFGSLAMGGVNMPPFPSPRYVSGSLQMLSVCPQPGIQEIVYRSICIRCFQAWMCGSMGDEIRYLMADPNIECWKGIHIPMLLVSTIAFVVYVVGTPTVSFQVLRYGMAHNLFTDKEFMEKFSWMYEIYELRWIYWQLMIFARRGLCAAVLVFCQKWAPNKLSRHNISRH